MINRIISLITLLLLSVNFVIAEFPDTPQEKKLSLYFGISMTQALQPEKITIEILMRFNVSNKEFIPILHEESADHWTTADGYSVKYERGNFYCRFAEAPNLAFALSAKYTPSVEFPVHVACTYDRERMNLYINGNLYASKEEHKAIWYGGRRRIVGYGYHSQRGGTGVLDAQIYELRIWNEARTERQIQELLNAKLNMGEAHLVGVWDLEWLEKYKSKPSNEDGIEFFEYGNQK